MATSLFYRSLLAGSLASLALLTSGCVFSGEKPVRKPFFDSWTDRLFPPKPGPAAPAAQTGISIPFIKPEPRRIWNGDGVSGAPSIKIAIGEQRAYFYKGKRQVGETDISSGRDGYDTPPGHYEVIQKDKEHRSTLYGEFIGANGAVVSSNADLTKQKPPPGTTFLGAKMPYFLRFQSGYGLHAGYLPGHRASHGCVRLPLGMAEHFFNNVEVGTPVLVTH